MLNVLAYVHLRRIVRSTGAGRAARCITEALSAQGGVDLRILGERADYKKIIDEAGPTWNGLRHHLYDAGTSQQQARWLFLRTPAAETYWPDVQVTFCTCESFVPVKRSRLVVTLNDAAHLENNVHRSGIASLKHRIKWDYLYKVLAKKADIFHTVSAFSAERLAHFWPVLRSRLRVVHHGVTPCFFQPPGAAAFETVRGMGLNEREFVLLPCGLDHRKNGDLVLDAWKDIHQAAPNLRLIVTSNASDPAYVARARTLGDSIVMPGHVSDDVMCALYHSAAVVWFPSRYEGFGLPILEAMACGAPVVTSNCTSIPEVAGDAALMLSADDKSAHIEAIRSIARDASLGEIYRVRGLQRARQFTWEKSAHTLKTLFENVA
jgi:glycosyltransferase involved in cell wall biosynthesis